MGEPADQDKAALDRVLAQLTEQFDSVQIIATRHRGAGVGEQTWLMHRGTGNWYARYGAVREWLAREDEGARDAMRDRGE